MELHFNKSILSCLDTPLREIKNSEQTQEIKVPDNMPDIGRIISAWGQCILRGKEWRSSTVGFSGGLMVWVLYEGEDGSGSHCLESWIPFQLGWDLPQGTPEGKLRITCLPRFVDARSVSPRKIMVRSGVAAQAEAFAPAALETYGPEGDSGNIQMLKSTYPVRLNKEAGEKTFSLEEDLILPASAPVPETIVYYRLHPTLTDKKVLTDKLVFRGNANLHVLYRSEEGQLHNWDFDLPFSQYDDLDGSHSPDAQGDVGLGVTNLELSLDDEGHMILRAGLVAQYVIQDKDLVQVVEDAYIPGQGLTLDKEMLELPVLLENRRENIYGEQSIQARANMAADVSFDPDFPRQRRGEQGMEWELPGTFQVLYYGEDGALRSGTARWEGRQGMLCGEDCQMTAMPGHLEPQTILGTEQIQVRGELPLDMTATTRQQIPMITDLKPGEQATPDPDRPSVILSRAGEGRLWDMAKAAGSTMEAIRQVNRLEGEPAPGQMLLIPVG